MKKGIIIGIIVAIIIVIGVTSVSQNNTDNSNQVSLDEGTTNEPKSFTVGLEESVGFSESP